jgi:ABC-type Fe3+/spermidine/putrescine transport system ATPase subunit
MSVVFQSYALWPHLSVRENVGYGPTTAKVARAEVRRRVDEALGLVQLDGMADRYAHQLSGGQQQRVALARALVNDPVLLLLDEPLSNLDTRLREEMRSEIRRIHRSLGVTMVYVTHDQAEALSLADRLVVMLSGRIVQVGSPEEVYRRPRTSFVARALGATNLLPATVSAAPTGDSVPLRLAAGISVIAPRPAGPVLQVGGEVVVSVRPVDLRLTAAPAGASEAGRVTESLFFGDHVQYTVQLPGLVQPVRATGPSIGRFDVGQTVTVFVLLFRELEMSVFLYSGANPTVATVLYNLASESLYQRVGALSVVVLLINIVVTVVAMRLLDRRPGEPSSRRRRPASVALTTPPEEAR